MDDVRLDGGDQNAGPMPASVPVVSDKDVPSRVRVAFAFVAMANNYQIALYRQPFQPFVEADGHIVDLPVAQEGAFRLACQLLGDYFSRKE